MALAFITHVQNLKLMETHRGLPMALESLFVCKKFLNGGTELV
jgi:hypothetical protein